MQVFQRWRLTIGCFDSEETLKTELKFERPQWIISSFGVGKHEPNLFSGYDTSPEELRWKSVQALAANNPQAYVSPPYLYPAVTPSSHAPKDQGDTDATPRRSRKSLTFTIKPAQPSTLPLITSQQPSNSLKSYTMLDIHRVLP